MVLRCRSLPPHNTHTHTVIWCHGRGSDAREFSEELWESHDSHGLSLQHIFPSVKWIFPESESRHAERFGGDLSQWFDIWSTGDPDERPELQLDGLRENTGKLMRLIQTESTRVGGTRNVVLAGISQGCAAAIHALLNFPTSPTPSTELLANSATGVESNSPPRLCAFVGLSSWMSLAANSAEETRQALGYEGPAPPSNDVYHNTPVFLSHSVNDDVVPVEQGRRLRDTLTAYGMDVTWKEYEKGGHWVYAPPVIDDLVAFLRQQGL